MFNNNVNNNKKYYWSPSVFWEKIDNKIKIEVFSYENAIETLFPKFYFLTQKGVFINDLLEAFPDMDNRKLSLFINDLIKKRILVSKLLTPQEIFYPQNRLYETSYGKELIFDSEALSNFKKKQLNRTFDLVDKKKIHLINDDVCSEPISERRSHRRFDEMSRISFDSFSKLLSVFKQLRNKDEIKYYYASAGGLYPIDIFIYVKSGRVENLNEGIYYYNPIDNCLQLVNDSVAINDNAHLFFNKDIFKSSAFSLYMIYNADVTMPKYKSNGYFYACIDTGIMVSTLTQVAEAVNIGLCSIGEMDFRKIEKYFKLNENQIYIHSIEVGLKITN